MSIDEETDFLIRLMELSPNEIDLNWKSFCTILDRLYESQMESFFEINPINKGPFLQAAEWLKSISVNFCGNPNRIAALLSFAEHFGIDHSDK